MPNGYEFASSLLAASAFLALAGAGRVRSMPSSGASTLTRERTTGPLICSVQCAQIGLMAGA